MSTTFRFVVLTGLGLLIPADASAQVIERPSRPFRGLFASGGPPADPNRTRQELTLTANALAGWEEGFVLGGGGIGDLRPGVTAYTGLAEARLRYFRGRTSHSWTVDGRAFTNSYSVDLPTTFGGDAQVQTDQNFGRSNRFQFRQGITYEPLLTLGGFDPLDTGVVPSVLPVSHATAGVIEQSSIGLNSAVSLTRTWSRRHSTSADYSFIRDDYLDESGFDSRTHRVAVSHSLSLTRRTSLRTSYHYSDVAAVDTSAQGPGTDQGADVGFVYDRALSPTRRMSFTVAGGATHVSMLQEGTNAPVEYWTPSGYGAMSLDFGRTWSVRGDFASGLTMLDSVTRQMFYTRAVGFQIGGLIGRRLETAVSAGFTAGRVGGGVSSEVGRYQSSLSTAQLSWALARCCAALVNYSYYDYRVEDVELSSGLPPRFNRNAIRAGLSIWLPLHEGFTDRPERGRGGR